MAHAPDVLREAIEEAALLAETEATLEQIGPVIRLARDALAAGNGNVPDEAVRDALHPSRWHRLGVA